MEHNTDVFIDHMILQDDGRFTIKFHDYNKQISVANAAPCCHGTFYDNPTCNSLFVTISFEIVRGYE